MRTTIVDHTDPDFVRRFVKIGRNNGAYTYSHDICKYHVRVWKEEAKRIGVKTLTIGTCAMLDTTTASDDLYGDLAIQYIHKYPQANPVKIILPAVEYLKDRFFRTVFVTSHITIMHQLQSLGLECVFVPMTIDATAIRANILEDRNPKPRTAIYLGNLIKGRLNTYQTVKAELNRLGWTVHAISSNKLNGRGDELKQEDIWRIASNYSLGIGVARSGLELMALGLPLLVVGNDFGGIATTEEEWQVQTRSNFGGLVTTYSRNIETCLSGIGHAFVGRTNDIPIALNAIRGSL